MYIRYVCERNSAFALSNPYPLCYNVYMRLDKFLKVSRIIKRRTVANEACELARVTINGKPAKPAKDVKIDDVIGIRFGDKDAFFKVLSVPTGNVSKSDADKLYEVIQE